MLQAKSGGVWVGCRDSGRHCGVPAEAYLTQCFKATPPLFTQSERQSIGARFGVFGSALMCGRVAKVMV